MKKGNLTGQNADKKRREESSPGHGVGMLAEGGRMMGVHEEKQEKVQRQKWTCPLGEDVGEKKGYYSYVRDNQVLNGFKYQGEEFGLKCWNPIILRVEQNFRGHLVQIIPKSKVKAQFGSFQVLLPWGPSELTV